MFRINRTLLFRTWLTSLALQTAISLLFTREFDNEHYELASFLYFSVNTVLVMFALKIAYAWRRRRLHSENVPLPDYLGWLCVVLLGIQPLVFQFNGIWVRDIADTFHNSNGGRSLLALAAWFNTLVLFNCSMLVSADVFSMLGETAFVFQRTLPTSAVVAAAADPWETELVELDDDPRRPTHLFIRSTNKDN
jgi:hypothetical protein